MLIGAVGRAPGCFTKEARAAVELIYFVSPPSSSSGPLVTFFGRRPFCGARPVNPVLPPRRRATPLPPRRRATPLSAEVVEKLVETAAAGGEGEGGAANRPVVFALSNPNSQAGDERASERGARVTVTACRGETDGRF